MKHTAFRSILLYFLIGILSGCANIVPPQGGKKDTKPPKLINIVPVDSQLNTRVTKLELYYNEFIELNNPAAEVQISPLIAIPPVVTATGKHVTIKIPDSLLQENTTYRISLNAAVKDLHEGNSAKPYVYSFSTGGYFDSMQLEGKVLDAATGLPDKDAFILVYSAKKSDSVVVKEKPAYVSKIADNGTFSLKGLPKQSFKVFALHDANNNLIYDGKGEMIAFLDSTVVPEDSVTNQLVLKSFKEIIIDTLPANIKKENRLNAFKDKKKDEIKLPMGYTVMVDTSSSSRRTFDVTKPLTINFDRKLDTFNKQKIFLSYDSSGILVESEFTITKDTGKSALLLAAKWKEDSVYTLRLQKGFAKDTSGNDALAGKFIFRTKNDDDYAKLDVHILPKYKDSQYILMVNGETDTVYNKPVLDTLVHLQKLQPGGYKMRIIVDKNKNGKWDTGDLFEKRQPEEVIPYDGAVLLKAGWENLVDFEKEKPKIKDDKASPERRDKAPAK